MSSGVWLCGIGCVLGSGPEVLISSTGAHIVFLLYLPPAPPVHPAVIWGPGICWGANSRPFLMKQAMVQVGLRVPTPLAAKKKGLFSCGVPSPAPEVLFAQLTVPA